MNRIVWSRFRWLLLACTAVTVAVTVAGPSRTGSLAMLAVVGVLAGGSALLLRGLFAQAQSSATTFSTTLMQAQERAGGLAERTAVIMGTTSGNRTGAVATTAQMTKLSDVVQQVRSSAAAAVERADELAAEAQSSVRVSAAGRESVEAIVVGMADIRQQVDQIGKEIFLLSEQTEKIRAITTTVDSLADQSHLLALNATIEAARAGEHGRSFAVVALEVRRLAEQSKQAAREVRGILEHITTASGAAVVATEKGTRSVEHGVQLAEQVGTTIVALSGTIGDAAHASAHLAASARQQSVSMGLVASGMDDATEQTRAVIGRAEKGFASAKASHDLARELEVLTAGAVTPVSAALLTS